MILNYTVYNVEVIMNVNRFNVQSCDALSALRLATGHMISNKHGK